MRRFAVAFLLAGCVAGAGGCSSDGSRSGGTLPAAFAMHRASWMTQPAPKQDLLYVSDSGANAVNVYAYPTGRLFGQITGQEDPTGLCADGLGDVWMVDTGSSRITQYAHGAKRLLARLQLTGAADLLGCAVDAEKGDLAVTDLGGPESTGAVWIFRHATGKPKLYQASFLASAYFAGYDPKGNLFVDGVDDKYAFVLAELPKGGKLLEQITLDQSVGFPGGVKWDGQYLAIGDQAYEHKRASAVYQVSISGSTGTVEGTTQLAVCDMLGFDIATEGSDHGLVPRDKIIAPDGCEDDAGIFNFPSGTGPTLVLSGLQFPASAVVSFADRLPPTR